MSWTDKLPDEPTFQQLRAAAAASPRRSPLPGSPTHVGGATTTSATTAEVVSRMSKGGGAVLDAPAAYVLSPSAKAALSAIEAKAAARPRTAASTAAAAAAAGGGGRAGGAGRPGGASGSGNNADGRGGGAPPQPDWLLRPFLRGAYVVRGHGAGADAQSMLHLSPSAQEEALVEEALYALMGLEADHIRAYATADGVVFQVASAADVDPSIADLLGRILPLATAYARVTAFVESASRYEAGLVSHALAAAIRELLSEYLIVIAQLEHEAGARRLNLQRLWFLIQPSLSTLTLLAQVSSNVASTRARGGALLSLLHDAAVVAAGDSAKRALVDHLLAAAAAPYFAMLTQWITAGKVDDPYDEFMVVEATNSAALLGLNDAYWTDKYVLRGASAVPRFLAPLAPTILTAGKYLNVVAGCGIAVDTAALLPPGATGVVYSTNERDYVHTVEAVHGAAAQLVLDLLFRKCALVERLASIKSYFLLGHGDVLAHFFEIAADELARPATAIDKPRLESLLELAVRSTTARGDPFKDDLGLVLAPLSVAQHVAHIDAAGTAAPPTDASLSGFDAFAFDFAVEWPLVLVLTTAAMTKYQLLSRHLIHTQRVCATLSRAWSVHKLTKAAHVAPYFKRAFALRSKMHHFVSTFLNYMFYQVIDPAWATLTAALDSAASLAQVVDAHDAFLNTALKECLLTHPGLLKVLTKLLSTCAIYADFVDRVDYQLSPSGRSVFVPPPPPRDDGPASEADIDHRLADRLGARRAAASFATEATVVALDAKFHRTLARFEENFGHNVRTFLQAVNNLSGAEKHMAALFAHLDFTGYYGEVLGLFSYS